MIDSEEQVRIATAIYPTASLMNHSCEPTISSRCFHPIVMMSSMLKSHFLFQLRAGSAYRSCCAWRHFRQWDLQLLRLVVAPHVYSSLAIVCERPACFVLGPHHTRMSYTERQQNLRTQYFFTCHCEHCASDARTADVINVSSPTQLFCSRSPILFFHSSPLHHLGCSVCEVWRRSAAIWRRRAEVSRL